jgi:predicted MFS family arabinose efflux permease
MPDPDTRGARSHSEDHETGLVVILVARVISNIPYRLSTFFLPAVARGLGVTLSAAGALVSTASLMGLVAPFFGAISDRSGGRRVMILATALFAIGALLMAGLPWYGVAVVAFGLIGLAKMAFDPAMQVFIGQRVPYERRGRVLGLTELAWALSLLAMPLCGWLIETVSWRAPFLLLGLVGLPVWWLTRRALPADLPSDQGLGSEPRGVQRILTSLLGQVRQVWRDPQSVLALVTLALIGFAQINVLVVYGAWMEDRFGLAVSNLGLVTLVIGAAELAAELAVAFVSDRVGKRRSVFVSVIFTGVAYLALPRLSGSLVAALVGSAVMTFFFEFTIVGLLPLVSGMNAEARGTLMSLGRAAGSASRAVAAPVGVALYTAGDIGRNGPVSALACLLLLLVLLRLRERGR